MLRTYQETIFFFLLLLLFAATLSHPLLGTHFEAQEAGGRLEISR